MDTNGEKVPRYTPEQMAAALRAIAPLCDQAFVWKGKRVGRVEEVVLAAADSLEENVRP